MTDINKKLLKDFLLTEETEDNESEDVTKNEYERIIDALGDFLAELDPESLPDGAQAALLILYNDLADVYDLDEESEDDESEDEELEEPEVEEDDDSLMEFKIRRISRSKHRAAHKKYLMMKRKKGSKMRMKAKLARKTAKYKTWAKRYAKKKKAGRTGKIRLA